MTLTVVPMTLVLYGLLYRRQRKEVLEPLALHPRRNRLAFLAFLTVYQALMSAMSLRGYAQELFARRYDWK
jgi:biofilm PGA synthesis N-glycosyltransferase PgaC